MKSDSIQIACFVHVLLLTPATTGAIERAKSPDCPFAFRSLASSNVVSPYFRRKNPQIQIWRLKELDRSSEAEAARQEISNAMRVENMNTIGVISKTSRNRTVLVELEGGLRAVWKRFTERTAKELTAYQFDELTDARLVPIVVERSLDGQSGTLQLFVRGTDRKKQIFGPRTLSLFDYLIAHTDRVEENYLVHRGRTIAIDNEGAFTIDPHPADFSNFPKFISEQLEKLRQANFSPEARAIGLNEITPSLVSRSFIERLRNMTNEQWRHGLTGLNVAEFESFLKRKNAALAAIDQAEAELGPLVDSIGRFSGLSRQRWPDKYRKIEWFLVHPTNVPESLKVRVKEAMDLIDKEQRTRKPLSAEETKKVDGVTQMLQPFR
jgi:hypothetical protein